MSQRLPLHRASSLAQVGAYLAPRDIAPGQLLRDMNIPAETLLGSNIWLPRDSVLELTWAIERRAGDELLGFHLGSLFELENYGEWTRRLLRCATLGQALRYLCLTLHEQETGTRLSLRRQGDSVSIRSEMLGKMTADPRHQHDAHLYVLVKFLRCASQPVALTLRLPRHYRRVAEVEALLDLRVECGCDHAELVFDAAALELPMTDTLPQPKHRASRAELTCQQVYREIVRTSDLSRPTTASIADELALSVRTMQRRLSSWGFSFEEILDSYRKRRALELLLHTRASVTEIAYGLGYSDAAHLTRAFRRWYGMPPRAARERARQGEGEAALANETAAPPLAPGFIAAPA